MITASEPAAQTGDRLVTGFVITVHGDSLFGAVSLGDRHDLRRSLRFRANGSDEVRDYSPDDLLEFGLADGTRFASRRVEAQDRHGVQGAFLQILIRGPLSLFVLRGRGSSYFIEADDFPLAMLRAQEEDFSLGEMQIRRRRPYVATLASAMHACPDVQRRAADARYTDRSLATIVRHYNRCMSGESESFSSGKRLTLHVAARVGAGAASLRSARLGSSRAHVVPYAGLAADVAIPHLPDGVALIAELAYMRKGNGDFEYFALNADPGSFALPYPDDFDGAYLSLQFGARYSFAVSGTRPYVTVGIAMSRLPGEAREVGPPLTGYQPARHDAGLFGDLGIMLPRAARVADLTFGLRLERATLGMKHPLDFREPSDLQFSNYSAVLTTGVRF